MAKTKQKKTTSNKKVAKTLKKVSKKEENSEILEPELLEALPPEIRKEVEFGFSMQRLSGPLPSPLMDKVTEEHITKVLEISEKDDERAYESIQTSRKFNLIYV
ncbi:MAG: hypothetical protein GY754_25615 [bacterium]|nr:hypothetical protein [bacterium]